MDTVKNGVLTDISKHKTNTSNVYPKDTLQQHIRTDTVKNGVQTLWCSHRINRILKDTSAYTDRQISKHKYRLTDKYNNGVRTDSIVS